MNVVGRGKRFEKDLEVAKRLIDGLNKKFDPQNMYQCNGKLTEIFEFQYKTEDKHSEVWQIVFMGVHTVVSGGFLGLDYSGYQEEDYLTLETKNEKKIFMLTVNNTIKLIDSFISSMAFADVSVKNKQKWIGVLKKGMEEDLI